MEHTLFGILNETRKRSRKMADDGFDPPLDWRRDLGAYERRKSNNDLPAILNRIDTQRLLEAFATGTLASLLAEPKPDRFPVEPPEGSVLKWVKTFDKPGRSGLREYTYVALRADGQWYLTGETSYGMAFAELVEQIGDSPCDLAMDWAPIPASEPSSSDDMSPAQWYLTTYPSETVEGDDE